MYTQIKTNTFQEEKNQNFSMSGSKLIVHRDCKMTFTIFYNIYKKLQKQAYDKSEFADACTCTDNACLVIKWVHDYNLY